MREQLATAIVCLLGAGGVASGAALTGSGSNLPIPSPNPGAPNAEPVSLTSVTGGFTGSWSAPALPAWQGSFSATGPIPSSVANPTGITNYDFTTMPTGLLPAGTFFIFGDVDGGSTQNETYVLRGFDASNMLITTPWLEEPFGVTGTGTGAGAYTIDGSTVTGGNPSLSVWIESNTGLAGLELERTSAFANFNLWAPIPAPGSAFALGVAGLALTRRRRA